MGKFICQEDYVNFLYSLIVNDYSMKFPLLDEETAIINGYFNENKPELVDQLKEMLKKFIQTVKQEHKPYVLNKVL